ncbi:hypothetical protein TNIN_51761 [Trichonephila inaurata madagascariensis]|uniref:Uncharacterized protein n=2 Tax=Trichonephila inaurata madagascariensis TaxID=2747483 RepID=A0A8X6XXT4_9ARAC|nr:hypothetical protein TNIN_51761 [Trichonephila inaurata madagascariensis]
MDIEYLKSGIGGFLSQALREVAIRRPQRPIESLAYLLIALHEKELERAKQKKSVSRQKVAKVVSSETKPDVMSSETKPEVMSSEAILEVVSSETKPEVASSEIKPEVVWSETQPEVVDVSSEFYERDSSEAGARRFTVVDTETHLNENIARLLQDSQEAENQELTAQEEMPHEYQVERAPSKSKSFIVP